MKRRFLFQILAMFGFSLPILAQNKLTVNADQGKDLISKHIYGHL